MEDISAKTMLLALHAHRSDSPEIRQQFDVHCREHNIPADKVFEAVGKLETVLVQATTTELSDKEKLDKIMKIAVDYGGCDGGHHKQHALDQIVRVITGPGYEKWKRNFEYQDGADDPEAEQFYEWDEGIP
jgi:hypothetical protein